MLKTYALKLVASGFDNKLKCSLIPSVEFSCCLFDMNRGNFRGRGRGFQSPPRGHFRGGRRGYQSGSSRGNFRREDGEYRSPSLSRGQHQGRGGRGHRGRGGSWSNGNNHGYEDNSFNSGRMNSYDGGEENFSGKRPKHLKGKAIGMWYAAKSKARKKQEGGQPQEKKKENITATVAMNSQQINAAYNALRKVSSMKEESAKQPASEVLKSAQSSESIASVSSSKLENPSKRSRYDEDFSFLSDEDSQREEMGEKSQDPAEIEVGAEEEVEETVELVAPIEDEIVDQHQYSGRYYETSSDVREKACKAARPSPEMLNFRKKLPAWDSKQKLLTMIEENQVILISGETGCGKTTQVPQFILDDAMERKKPCRVVCTQPRRISAISVAERVAKERGEEVGEGNSCGYQIRLQSRLPRSHFSILYCTTGILIQWMTSDATLSNVSHIVLDEIHERDLLSDFLLTIVKRILATRKDMKVVLMSATLNSTIFSGYFNSCPTLHIPGFTFPVTEFYLEDIIETLKYQPSRDAYNEMEKMTRGGCDWRVMKALDHDERSKFRVERDQYKSELTNYEVQLRQYGHSPQTSKSICVMDNFLQRKVDCELILQLIKHVITHPPSSRTRGGAFLVFQPGWEDIKNLNELIAKDRFFSSDRYLVIPLHSMMPTAGQRQVFDRPPPGLTKIVIATNIAETSITIDDIVYVVNAGKIKVRNLDAGKNISTLTSQWVSRANARQRRGRAGRVQEGFCYHLYTQHLQEPKFKDYMVPEILRTPLDQLCLHIKLLKLGGIAEFTSELMEKPDEQSIALSISKLRALNALDRDEKLTPLGHHLAKLPVEPQIGKMLLLSTIFSCVGPVLTVASALSFKDPFMLPLGKEKQADERKKLLAGNCFSDHVLQVRTFNRWKQACRSGGDQHFCWHNFLSGSILRMLDQMRGQFAQQLRAAGFLATGEQDAPQHNRLSHDMEVVQAIVCAGLYPNIAQMKRRGRKGKGRLPPVLATKRERVAIHPKSVNAKMKFEEFPHQWVCFYEKMKTAEIYLFDTSVVGPYPLLFFGGDIRTFKDPQGDDMISVDDWIQFKARPQVIVTVQELRMELDRILERKIREPHLQWWKGGEKCILDTITDLLSSKLPSRPHP